MHDGPMLAQAPVLRRRAVAPEMGSGYDDEMSAYRITRARHYEETRPIGAAPPCANDVHTAAMSAHNGAFELALQRLRLAHCHAFALSRVLATYCFTTRIDLILTF
jgi:hypothetical protein